MKPNGDELSALRQANSHTHKKAMKHSLQGNGDKSFTGVTPRLGHKGFQQHVQKWLFPQCHFLSSLPTLSLTPPPT